MKRRLFFFVAFLVLVAALAAGCGAQPTVEAPQEDLGAIEDKSAAVVEEKEATMTPVPTPEPTESKVPPEAEDAVEGLCFAVPRAELHLLPVVLDGVMR